MNKNEPIAQLYQQVREMAKDLKIQLVLTSPQYVPLTPTFIIDYPPRLMMSTVKGRPATSGGVAIYHVGNFKELQ